MNMVEASTAYVRTKVARGDWWGESIRRNQMTLWRFTAWLPKAVSVDVRRVKRRHVQGFLDRDPAHSPSYKRAQRATLRGLFAWLHQEGRIALNPTVGVTVPEVPGTAPSAWTDEEVAQLLVVARRDPRELVVVSLAFNEGLRAVEIARALIEDLHERTGTLKVRGKFYRGKVSRTAAVSPETLAAITGYRAAAPAQQAGPLVQSRLQPGVALGSHGIRQVFDAVVRDAGLKRHPFDGMSSHGGRRTAATQGVEAGVPTPIMLRQFGWSSEAMLLHYSRGAALNLHEFHRARAARREQPPDEAA